MCGNRRDIRGVAGPSSPAGRSVGPSGRRTSWGPHAVTRWSRLVLVGTAVASSFAVTALLTSLSSVSDGPIAATLDRVGTAVGSIEYGIRRRFGGTFRRNAALEWFAPYRDTTDQLRRPD